MDKWFGDTSPCVYGQLVKIPLSSFTYPVESDSVDIIAAIYSTMPLVILFGILCYGLLKRNFKFLLLLCGFIFHYPFTQILKVIIKQSRPIGTCNKSPGMPSGHSFVSISVFVLITFVILEKLIYIPHTTKKSRRTFFLSIFLFLAGILLIPVPWSRVHLKDHSVEQVVIGGILGAIWGGIWYKLLQIRLSKPT
jgi:dolichyldiphosphatase